jgi:NAD(P)-dependent dehydrogenase (short-subunit alcohol dehydrogenase family)
MSVYSGTKFAVRAISEGLRQEAGAVAAQFGYLDILVNNTGITAPDDGPTKGKINPPAVVSHSVRIMFIRSSILRTMEGRLELRLCSMLSPVKKGQDQFRKGVRIHLWTLDLNILGEELL